MTSSKVGVCSGFGFGARENGDGFVVREKEIGEPQSRLIL